MRTPKEILFSYCALLILPISCLQNSATNSSTQSEYTGNYGVAIEEGDNPDESLPEETDLKKSLDDEEEHSTAGCAQAPAAPAHSSVTVSTAEQIFFPKHRHVINVNGIYQNGVFQKRGESKENINTFAEKDVVSYEHFAVKVRKTVQGYELSYTDENCYQVKLTAQKHSVGAGIPFSSLEQANTSPQIYYKKTALERIPATSDACRNSRSTQQQGFVYWFNHYLAQGYFTIEDIAPDENTDSHGLAIRVNWIASSASSNGLNYNSNLYVFTSEVACYR